MPEFAEKTKTKLITAYIFGGMVLFCFLGALIGFGYSMKAQKEEAKYRQLALWAQETNSAFQLSISKAKNFAILQDPKDKNLILSYFKNAKDSFNRLSSLDLDPQEQPLLYGLGSAIKGVEYPLGIMAATAKKTDPAERLYERYLKDITIDFDDSCRAYIDVLNARASQIHTRVSSLIQMNVALLGLGMLLAMFFVGVGYSIASDLRHALRDEISLFEKERNLRVLTEKAERTIRESEQRLQLFDDLTEELIMVHDRGNIVEVNQSFLNQLGYNKPEVIGKSLLLFMDEGSSKDTQERIRQGYPDGTFEINAKRKDGTTFPLLVHGSDFEFRGRKVRASSGWDISQLKKAREELSESVNWFKRFAEIAKEGIFIHEAGKIIDLNAALGRMMGYEVAEMKGTNPMIYVDPASREKASDRLSRRVEEPYEIVLKRKDGSEFPAEIHGRNYSFQGVPLRITSIWDITERKKIEESLRQSEENFRSLIERAPDAVLVHQDGKIVYVNQKCLELLGYGVGEELVSRSPIEIVFKEDMEKVSKRIDASLQGAKNPVIEVRVIRKDGSLTPIESNSVGIQYHARPAVMVLMHDIKERKAAEDVLKLSEAKFRSLIENSHDLILVLDAQGRWTYETSSLERMLGIKPGEKGKSFFETFPLEEREKIELLYEVVLANPGVPLQVQLQAKRADGRVIDLDMVLTNLLKDPAVRGIVVNGRDVTDKKRSEQALRRSEARFRGMIENSYDLITVLDRDGKRLYESPSLGRILGYQPGERSGVTFDTQPPEEREMARALFERALANPGVPIQAQMKAIRKDGRIIETDMVLTNLLEDPAVKGIVVNGRDVTDKKRAEEALQQSEEKFRNLIENSNDVISLVTTEMKTLYVSPSLKKVMGYTMEERMEKSFLELVHPEDRPAVIERFKKFAADFGATARMEVRALHKDGTYRHVDAIATNLIQHPTMRGIIFNYRDITDRKKAEQALLKFERLSAIGQMAAGMAHEIRNPLSAIFTAAQILKRHEMKTGEKGFADMILENSQRLEKLIQDTLGYARAEKIAPQEAFALQPMLESAIRLCQIQYGPNHKMIKIEWELPSEPLTLWAPPQRVQQILVNLILNAYQIMGKEGTLSLGLAREEEWAVVRVGDTGPGIPENQMARLFEPFFTTKENGSGLGLALSQRIARECGGEIQAQNKESGGAAFVLRLPLEKKGTAS